MATAQEGSAAYVGFERISGRLHGRAGTFVLHHTATRTAGSDSSSLSVLASSGTDELKGLHGEGLIVIGPAGEHTLNLDYELG